MTEREKLYYLYVFLLSLQRSSHHNIFLSSMDLIVEYEIIYLPDDGYHHSCQCRSKTGNCEMEFMDIHSFYGNGLIALDRFSGS